MITINAPHPMKASYRQLHALPDESFRLLEVSGPDAGCSWHFHPEHQIGFVLRGMGERVVGDHVCPITPGEVVLLGANLPHVWHYQGGSRPDDVQALVIHFSDDFLGTEFFRKPELRDIRRLLARARLGLQAIGATRMKAAALIQQMVEHEGFQRLVDLLSLLNMLASSSEMTTLCSSGFQPLAAAGEIKRLREVCDYIQRHYSDPLDRDAIAAIAHLSPSAFSRFFKVHTGKTFRDFVAEVRVGHACRLLLQADDNITEVAMRCGFADGSVFDRSFRRLKKMSPTQFRRQVKDAIR
jgi:AraC-like DNA-binding protein/quercetin dioxygenase-like cupin family protein